MFCRVKVSWRSGVCDMPCGGEARVGVTDCRVVADGDPPRRGGLSSLVDRWVDVEDGTDALRTP